MVNSKGPIAELIKEKYDEKWTGRTIKIDKIRINLFTGGVNIYDVTVFEPVKADTFVHVNHFYANLEWTHFLKGEYDLLEVSVYRPYVSVIQNGYSFNFDDLIRKFAIKPDSTTTAESREGLHYRIENVHVDSARISYREINIGSALTIMNANSRCPLIAWSEPAHHYDFNAKLSSGGAVQSAMDIDIRTLLYSLQASAKEVNIYGIRNMN